MIEEVADAGINQILALLVPIIPGAHKHRGRRCFFHEDYPLQRRRLTQECRDLYGNPGQLQASYLRKT
jgi:hypothetical protein